MKKIISLIFLITILFISNMSYANDAINVKIDKTTLQKDDIFNIGLDFENKDIASFTINMFYDNSKIEYQKNIENSNLKDNTIIFTWTASNMNDLENELTNLPTFEFKVLEEGSSMIIVTGEYYDSNGEKVAIADESHQIYLGVVETIQSDVETQNEYSLEKNNSKLQILRTGLEGLIPTFDPNIYEYYYVADNSLTDVEIEAIPQNENANININGNTNLQNGLNEVIIEVISEDKTSTSTYKINITKTDNKASANTKLITFAINNAQITPPFNDQSTNYRTEVDNSISELQILAIPEDQNANVEIVNNQNFHTGENYVQIIVTAADGVTKKTYNLTVYKRNTVEDEEVQNKISYDSQLLSTLLDDTQNNIENSSETLIENDETSILPFILIGAVIVIGGISIFVYIKIRKR